MAKLNGLYLFITSEEVSYGVEATTHPVEDGIDITDHVRRKARSISLSGEIVGSNASTIRSKIIALHQKGALCEYAGRTSLSDCIIEDFSTSHPNTVWGGCEFSMTLKEIRTAKSAYKSGSRTRASTQQITSKSTSSNVYHTVKKGDCVWALVAASNAPYKKYGATCNQVMAWNPDAFSRRGDFRTLKIGYRLKVGERK